MKRGGVAGGEVLSGGWEGLAARDGVEGGSRTALSGTSGFSESDLRFFRRCFSLENIVRPRNDKPSPAHLHGGPEMARLFIHRKE